MSVRTLCLAILAFGDATGYEIRKESTEGRFSYFDDASFGSIYPALARLEADGLVTVREEHQQGKPARKVYSITEKGKDEFLASLCEPQGADTFKSPFLLIALYAAELGPDVIRRALNRRRDQVLAELKQLEYCAEENPHPGSQWIRDYGLSYMNFTLDYLDKHGDDLVRIAQDKQVATQAAAE